jgi:hypothetical protein
MILDDVENIIVNCLQNSNGNSKLQPITMVVTSPQNLILKPIKCSVQSIRKAKVYQPK